MKKIKLPDYLEAIVQQALSKPTFIPTQYKPKPLWGYLPKEKPEEFKRDWIQYESHCRREKFMFFKILKNATDYLDIKYNYKGNGRPNAFISDIIKSLCIRIYSNYSSWRCESELKIAKSMGIIDNVYKKSTLNKYLQLKIINDKLKGLFKLLADPIAPIEIHFSIDSTGFGHSYGTPRWVNAQKHYEKRNKFRKLHIISGAKSNIIVAAKITDGFRNDCPMLKELLNSISLRRYNIREFSADAGYLSKKNVRLICSKGAMPFIQPKKNTYVNPRYVWSAWGRMVKLWKENNSLFSQYYHQRSNVEATFGMIKRKWGGYCRAKIPSSQENELLCKIVCHNAVILARVMIDFNLDVKFMAT